MLYKYTWKHQVSHLTNFKTSSHLCVITKISLPKSSGRALTRATFCTSKLNLFLPARWVGDLTWVTRARLRTTSGDLTQECLWIMGMHVLTWFATHAQQPVPSRKLYRTVYSYMMGRKLTWVSTHDFTRTPGNFTRTLNWYVKWPPTHAFIQDLRLCIFTSAWPHPRLGT